MTDDKKPNEAWREFWLDHCEHYSKEIKEFIEANRHLPENTNFNFDNLVHVIEYSAYEQAQKEIAKKDAEIARLKRALAHDLMDNDENGTEFCYVMALKEQITELREALEFYGNGGNFNFDLWEHEELGHFTGKRAREVLNKFGRGSNV